MQLTIDGREVDVAGTTAHRSLTATQREIVRVARFGHGQITSAQAGRIVHAARENYCARTEGPRCCQWCSSDGWSAMKRLEKRGLFRHGAGRGVWEIVSL